MKKCHRCHVEKAVEEFPKNKSKRDGHSETCLECKREYNRKHYANNKSYYVDKAKKLTVDLKKWILDYKVSKGCKYCPENHPGCLHFHHRDPSQKKFNLARGFSKSLSRIKEEIAKCDVVCANCHGKIHWSSECDGFAHNFPKVVEEVRFL